MRAFAGEIVKEVEGMVMGIEGSRVRGLDEERGEGEKPM